MTSQWPTDQIFLAVQGGTTKNFQHKNKPCNCTVHCSVCFPGTKMCTLWGRGKMCLFQISSNYKWDKCVLWYWQFRDEPQVIGSLLFGGPVIMEVEPYSFKEDDHSNHINKINILLVILIHYLVKYPYFSWSQEMTLGPAPPLGPIFLGPRSRPIKWGRVIGIPGDWPGYIGYIGRGTTPKWPPKMGHFQGDDIVSTRNSM